MSDIGALAATTREVYRQLLRRPGLTPEDLAVRCDRAVDDVWRDIDVLRSHGLLTVDPADPKRPRPVRPDRVIDELIRAGERELERREHELDVARRDLLDAVDDYLVGQRRESGDLSLEIVVGLAAIRARLDDFTRATKREYLALMTGVNDSADVIEAARDEDADLYARHVSIRTIYPAAVREMPNIWAYALETAAAGEQIRLSDDIPARMLIRDREAAVVPLDPTDPDAAAVFIDSPVVVSTLVSLFELCWARATPILAGTTTEAAGPRDSALLNLLAAGAKDETIARQLGLNVRTVRRDIATLMNELRASTRFQAGVQASRRGWV